jgi:hypothetical protein
MNMANIRYDEMLENPLNIRRSLVPKAEATCQAPVARTWGIELLKREKRGGAGQGKIRNVEQNIRKRPPGRQSCRWEELKKWYMRMWTEFNWLIIGIGGGGGCCEHETKVWVP